MNEIAVKPWITLSGKGRGGKPINESIFLNKGDVIENGYNSLSLIVPNVISNRLDILFRFICQKQYANEFVPLSFMDVNEDGQNIKLKKPFIVNYRKQGDHYLAEKEDINLYCWGKNVKELQDDINENLYALFKNYVECDTDELTDDAINLRKKLMEYF